MFQASPQLCDPLNDSCGVTKRELLKEHPAAWPRTSPSPAASPSLLTCRGHSWSAGRSPRDAGRPPGLPPPRVVLSTAALSNDLWSVPPASAASSPAWWRRWGHAEAAHPGVPPADTQRQLLHCGVRQGVSGPARHCTAGCTAQFVPFNRAGVEIGGEACWNVLWEQRIPYDGTRVKYVKHKRRRTPSEAPRLIPISLERPSCELQM